MEFSRFSPDAIEMASAIREMLSVLLASLYISKWQLDILKVGGQVEPPGKAMVECLCSFVELRTGLSLILVLHIT